MATAHQVPCRATQTPVHTDDAEPDGLSFGAGRGREEGEEQDVYGAAPWSLLLAWYADADENSAVQTLIFSLAPTLLFTWWSLATLQEPPLAMGDLEALLLGVYHLHHLHQPGASSTSSGTRRDVPSRHLVERFVTTSSSLLTASSPSPPVERFVTASSSSPVAAAFREHARNSGGGGKGATASMLSQSALEMHTIASAAGAGAGARHPNESAEFDSRVGVTAGTSEVRVDGEPCHVAAFWLESFKENLLRMPLSARVLFIDMCTILLSSGYRAVTLKRGRARAATRSRLAAAAGGCRSAGAAAGQASGVRRSAGTAAATTRAAAAASSLPGVAVSAGGPMLPELSGWGGDWSALGSGSGGGGYGLDQRPLASGAGTSGGHLGGLVQLCPLATLELCNFGPRFVSSPLEPPGPHLKRPGSHCQDQDRDAALECADVLAQTCPQRLGRRVRVSTLVFMQMSAVLRVMIGHTRLEMLLREFGDEGEGGAAQRAGAGGGAAGGGEGRGVGGGSSEDEGVCEEEQYSGGQYGRGGGSERIGGEDTCGWQHACIEEEVRRFVAARALSPSLPVCLSLFSSLSLSHARSLPRSLS